MFRLASVHSFNNPKCHPLSSASLIEFWLPDDKKRSLLKYNGGKENE